MQILFDFYSSFFYSLISLFFAILIVHFVFVASFCVFSNKQKNLISQT